MDNEHSWVGKQIGSYKLIEVLFESINSYLYLARHETQPEQTVVFKRLACWLDENDRKLFLKEAGLLTRVQHPCILPILQVGVEEGYPYVIAEYALGGSLRDKLEQQQEQLLPQSEIERILVQIAQGLKGGWPMSHRDLRPATILFDAQGNVQIAYFYLTYFTHLMRFLHTTQQARQNVYFNAPSFSYTAPELVVGQWSGLEADQYSLGSIAYELFTGNRPFSTLLEPLARLPAGAQPDQGTVLEIVARYLGEAPLSPRNFNPVLPLFQEQAILKAMARNPRDRYPDIPTFIAALFPESHQPEKESIL